MADMAAGLKTAFSDHLDISTERQKVKDFIEGERITRLKEEIQAISKSKEDSDEHGNNQHCDGQTDAGFIE